MLSILIPTYNYNTFPLAEELEKQALQLGIEFELICMDDGSFSPLNEVNQKINALTNCRFIENHKNIGRVAIRKLLAEHANYNWLLFLDSDMKPAKGDCVKHYLEYLNSSYDVIFGGYAYKKEDLDPSRSLRHKFGSEREQVESKKRNKNPYKITLSGNCLIKKDIFQKIYKDIDWDSYGMDYFFGSRLNQLKIPALHIDNETFHFGIEDNLEFLTKTKFALKNLHTLFNQKRINVNGITILKYYKVLKALKLIWLFRGFITIFEKHIEKNLLGPKPNLLFFDLYRLGYLCRL